MSSAVLHSSLGATLSANCWTSLPIDASQEANRYFEHSSVAALPKADLEHLSDGFLSVYCFVKNFVGVSGGGQSANSTIAIDSKIEEALDLVKSNLMFAVREEVDVLKEKIDELMNKVNRLEFENSILRAHASSEALSLLQKPHQTQHSSNSSRRSTTYNVYNNDSNNNKSSSHEL